MFKLLRFYSVASLIAVLSTAVLLTWFYRQVAIQGIVHLAERGNMNLAQLAMNPIKPALLAFLDTTSDLRPGSAGPALPLELARAISAVMQEDHFIARIKIYNPQGLVVFSTTPAQLGDDQSRNEGFIAAIRGGVGSELVYRDTFNSFDGVTEEDNLMQTYLPIRAGPAEPIRGVFELYGDVNNLMHQTERTQVIVMTGAFFILLALYAVLILIVRHANGTIERQQRTITERTETLALLADHMLKTEESQKQKIAFELHEGVAQTLAALKLKAESRQNDPKANDARLGSPDSIIPMLQEAIQEVRSIATDLRPASLDDLGLLPTIDWLCREFEQRQSGIRIERRISLEERDIPAPLKGILYRIIMSALGDMAQQPNTRQIELVLRVYDNVLSLLINDQATMETADTPLTDIKPQLHAGFARMEELTTLSGGAFTASHHPDGGTTLRAEWIT
jgi:signal transduction histidine kinase